MPFPWTGFNTPNGKPYPPEEMLETLNRLWREGRLTQGEWETLTAFTNFVTAFPQVWKDKPKGN